MEKNQIKITDQELSEINQLRKSIGENIDMVGNLHIRKHFLSKEISTVESDIINTLEITEQLNLMEKEKISQIIEKYGEGNLDFETGIYYPA